MELTETRQGRAAMSSTETRHDLYGYSYDDRHGLLPTLTTAVTEAGGWVLERKTVSATSLQFRVEIQMYGIEELYAALMGTGIELTRTTHAVLTELCTRRRYQERGGQRGQVVTLNLELSFLEDLTLHSVMTTGTALA